MLTPGSTMEIETDLGERRAVLGGHIVSSTDDMTIVRVAVERGAHLPVERGMVVVGSVVERSRILRFDTEVLATTRDRTLVELALGPPRALREERRSFYRFDHAVPVTVRERRPDGRKGPTTSTETTDIGGGGIGFLTGQHFPIGTRLACKVLLDDGVGRALAVDGTVVRAAELPATEPLAYQTGVVFDEIAEPERERLIGYIFDKQRELRQKGVL